MESTYLGHKLRHTDKLVCHDLTHNLSFIFYKANTEIIELH